MIGLVFHPMVSRVFKHHSPQPKLQIVEKKSIFSQLPGIFSPAIPTCPDDCSLPGSWEGRCSAAPGCPRQAGPGTPGGLAPWRYGKFPPITMFFREGKPSENAAEHLGSSAARGNSKRTWPHLQPRLMRGLRGYEAMINHQTHAEKLQETSLSQE